MKKFNDLLNVKLNPLLSYLLKRRTFDYVEILIPILVLWLVGVLFIFELFTGSGDSGLFLAILVCGALYIPLILIPPIVAYLSASASARFAASNRYDLLVLTNISDTTLLWSYIAATLYRLRVLLIIVIGLSPTIDVMTSIDWAFIQNGFDDVSCLTTPIGTVYCESTDAGPSPTGDKQLDKGDKLSAVTLALATFVGGMYVLTAAIGAILGFRLKERLLALSTALVLGFVVSLWTCIIIVPELILRAIGKEGFDPSEILFVTLLAVVPYFLAFALIRVASPLVRRPA